MGKVWKFLAGGLVLASCGGSVKYTDVQVTPTGKYLSKVRHNLPVLDLTTDSELIASAMRSCQLLEAKFSYDRVTRLADEDRAKLSAEEISQYEQMFRYGIDAFCPEYQN